MLYVFVLVLLVIPIILVVKRTLFDSSKSLVAEADKNIENMRDLISNTSDPLKRKILNNHLGNLIQNDVDMRLKPLMDKWAKKMGKRPTTKIKEQYQIYEEQYNIAVAEYKSLIFDVENELSDVEKQIYADLCESFQTFCSCNKIWKIHSTSRNTELKSSANTTVQRTPTILITGIFDHLFVPNGVPTFPLSDGRSVYFYPQFVVVGKTISDFDVVLIEDVSLVYKPTRFIEDGIRPMDAKQVSTTYKYINKNGEPDRRYSYNPALPVFLYGEVMLQPYGETFQVSNNEAAVQLGLAFKKWKSYNAEPLDDSMNESRQAEQITESYFNDLLSAAKRLLDFGKDIADNLDFCRVVNNSISGNVSWNGKQLIEARDKIPVFLWADVVHCYMGLGHKIDVLSNEGVGLLIYNMLMINPHFSIEYKSLNFIRVTLKDSVEEFIHNAVSSMKGNTNIFLIEFCLKEFDDKMHNQYVVLLYRFASLIAKADRNISEKEASWLNKIMELRISEDALTSVNLIEDPLINKKEFVKNTHPNATKELDGLIGLTSVKSEVTSLANYIKVQKMREEKGMKVTPVSLHCVFTGNPGTGKTTVARIVSEIYKEMGILKKGHLVEIDRSGLVAEYVGQTAVKTNNVIDSALDGILFIDEAYSLVDGGNSDYGKEAIATLLKRMEDERERLVVILAGYTKEMKCFIDSNPGLQSRFNRYIEFPDYSTEELYQIFCLNAKKYDYVLTDDAQKVLQGVFENAVANKDKNFGNGRFVRNLFEKVVEHQANRLSAEIDITAEALATIKTSDIQSVYNKYIITKQYESIQ